MKTRTNFPDSSNRVSVWLLALLAFGLTTTRADWPDFRGPRGDGHVSAPGDTKPLGLPLTWSETNNIKWKTEIPYRGWSTPVIMGGQVWMTTATEDGHDYFAICVDQESGKIRLQRESVSHRQSRAAGQRRIHEFLRHAFARDRAGPGLRPLRQRRHSVSGYQDRPRFSGSETTCPAAIIAARRRRRCCSRTC